MVQIAVWPLLQWSVHLLIGGWVRWRKGATGDAVMDRVMEVEAGAGWARLLARGLLAIAVIAQVWVAWRFWANTWDDSAITLGFARTFALTGRIEPTPGSGLVEGYSTTLWMLLMAATARMGASAAAMMAIAKVLTLLLNLLNLLLIRSWVRAWQGDVTADLTAGVFGCAFTFYETVNGMETPLLVALLFVMLLLRRAEGGRWARVAYLAAGIGVLLTRWESVFLLLPFVLLDGPRRRAIGAAVCWGAAFLLSTAARWAYFGALVPNTITAKRHSPYSDAAWHEGMKQRLLQPGAIVAACWFALLVGAGYLLYLLATRQGARWNLREELRRSPELRFALLFTVFAGLLATAIGPNWGPPLRTFYEGWPFLIALLLLPLSAGERRAANRRGGRGAALTLATAVLCGLTLLTMFARIREMSVPNAPSYMATVTVDKIARLNEVMDDIRAASGRKTLVYAGPDLGGILLYSTGIEVVDVGLLCDRVLARDGYAAVEPYLLEQRRPDVIEVHRFWTSLTKLESSERFRAEYEPVDVDGLRLFLRRDLVQSIAPGRLRRASFGADGSFPDFDAERFPFIRYNAPDLAINRSFGSYLVLQRGGPDAGLE